MRMTGTRRALTLKGRMLDLEQRVTQLENLRGETESLVRAISEHNRMLEETLQVRESELRLLRDVHRNGH